MQAQVHAPNAAMTEQVEQLLRFYLTGLEEHVVSIAIKVETTRDPLGNALLHCAVHARLGCEGELCIDEIQSDLLLAMTRALDRCVRTLRRRGAGVRLRRHS
jgi:hypothetical protein